MSLPRTLGLLAVALICLASHAPAQSGMDDRWLTDHGEALSRAESNGQDLLVWFRGGEWSDRCRMLESVVFRGGDASGLVQRLRLVPLRLDFPPAGASEELAQLKAKYHVAAFPTLLVMTPEGQVFARMGGLPLIQDPENQAQTSAARTAYLTKLEVAYESGKQLLSASQQLVERHESARGESRRMMALGALEILKKARAGQVHVGPLAGVLKQALSRSDSGRLEGLRAETALQVLITLGEVDDAVLEAAQRMQSREQPYVDQALASLFGQVGDQQAADAAVAFLEKHEGVRFNDPSLKVELYADATRWMQDARMRLLGQAHAAKLRADMLEKRPEVRWDDDPRKVEEGQREIEAARKVASETSARAREYAARAKAWADKLEAVLDDAGSARGAHETLIEMVRAN
jgi:hypothetical protein